MGDIKPKRKDPAPDQPASPLSESAPNPPASPGPVPNPIADPALGEAPGSSVTMPEIPGWNAEAPEPTAPPKGYFPPVDLIEAWRRAAAEAQGMQDAQAAAAEPAPPEPAAVPSEHPTPSNRLLILLTALGILAVAAAGGAYYVFFRPEPESPRPVVAPTITPIATPSPTSTPRPTRALAPPPAPAPAPPPPSGQRTYTVVPGDTLITIGERFGVDWQAIAAANGDITDPNFITPGQVLTIP